MAKKTATKFEEKTPAKQTTFKEKPATAKNPVKNALKNALSTSMSGSTSSLTNALKQSLAATAMQPTTPDTPTYDTSAYDAMYNEFAARQQEVAAKQKAETTEEYNKQLKGAYITRMQNQKALDENLTRMGIRGGATETANLNLLSNYENSRNTLNSDKMKALQTIDDNLSDNLFNYKQQIDMAKLAYLEQRQAEDRQLAQTKAENALARQEALAAEQRAYAREDALYAQEQAAKRAEQQAAQKEAQKAAKAAANSDFWTAKYSTYYNINNLNTAYKNATTAAEKTIIKARIGYLQAQKKGY